MVYIFDPACELLPPWTKELYLCTVAPLPSLLPPPPPSPRYSVAVSRCCNIKYKHGLINNIDTKARNRNLTFFSL
jgi:hypothetical protein